MSNVKIRTLCPLLIALLFATGLTYAQELDAEFSLYKAKYRELVEALTKQKAEANSKASQPYLDALKSVEKAAMGKGDLELVGAVMKEREAVSRGVLEVEMPAALPKFRLNMTRSSLIRSLEKIDTDYKKRSLQLDVEYLRMLNALQTKVPSGSELMKRIAAEKESLLSRSASHERDVKEDAVRGRNVVENGSFDKVKDKKPVGWVSPESCSVAKEIGNFYAHIEVSSPANDGTAPACFFEQTISIPRGAKQVLISGKVRVKDYFKIKDRGPFIALRYLDSMGKPRICSVKYIRASNIWSIVQGECSLENPSQTGSLLLHNGSLSGQIDFDDIVVTFK